MLEQVARHIANYPEIKAQAEQLIQETHAQAAALQDYMEQRSGESIIVPKQPANSVQEQSLSGAFVGSEAVKRALTEISTYNILLAAAESAGDSETRAVCDTIRRQEEAMLEWLRKFLGAATETHIVESLAISKDASRRPRKGKASPKQPPPPASNSTGD